MKKTLLVLRGMIEALIGLLFTLNAPVQLIKILGRLGSPAYSGAYLAGTLVGIAIAWCLGFWYYAMHFECFAESSAPVP